MKSYSLGFTHEQLVELQPGTVGCMAYNCIRGDTLREIGEAVYVKVIELANIITAKVGPGYMWVACSDMVYNHIYHYVKQSDEELFEYGGKDIRFMGIINRNIRVYVDPLLSTNVIYLGNTREQKAESKHFLRFTFSGMPGGEKDQWDFDPEYFCKIGVDKVS